MLKVFEAFSGFGGGSFALKRARIPFEVVGHSEIFPPSVSIYNLNHPNVVNYGDITKISYRDLGSFDLFLGGFPCQSYSNAGLGKGIEDLRGLVIYDVIKICEQKRPKNILLENVKGLISKRHKHTFDMIIKSFQDLGYYAHWEVLNTKNYGIPQNRERVWMYFSQYNIPQGFQLAPKTVDTRPMEEFLDKNPSPDLYKSQDQILKGKNTRAILEKYQSYDKTQYYFADMYNKLIKKISPTLTEVHHNSIRVIEPWSGQFRLRKLSVAEHFRLMGLEENEIDLGNYSYSACCNRAANGWDVNLSSQILSNIINRRVF